VAARRAGDLDCRQPERVDRRFRPARAEAPDRRADGQRRAALRRRLLVPVLSRDGAFGRRPARGGPSQNRAVGGAQPEKRARRTRVRPCLLRERRTRYGTGLFVALARDVSRDGFFYRHLSWHLSLVEIALGHTAEAQDVYRHAIELGRHSGGPQQKVSDACAFLWRSELAGHPRNAATWRALYDYAGETLPRPGSGL